MPSISSEFIDLQPEPFHSYVFIMTTERMPSSIAMAAVAGGGMKYIDLDFSATIKNLPGPSRFSRVYCGNPSANASSAANT